jgi:hypothetical protein
MLSADRYLKIDDGSIYWGNGNRREGILKLFRTEAETLDYIEDKGFHAVKPVFVSSEFKKPFEI